MNIKPSAAIQENYDDFSRRESMLRLRETLLQSEADIQNGRCHTVEETANAMRQVIAEVSDARRNRL
jgi:hypothetical protein